MTNYSHYPSFRGTNLFTETVLLLKNTPKEKRPPILVYGDPDIDGLISMRETLLFLQKELEDDTIPYYVNSNRGHGFFLPPEKLQGYFVFCVDFSIERPQLEDLIKHNITVISIDHHECEDNSIQVGTPSLTEPFGFVVNNQYPFEDQEWTFQSGMGVLYHCISTYYDHLNQPSYKQGMTTRALVGLTLLSDIRNIEMTYARPFLDALYKHPVEGYIEYLITSTHGSDYSFGLPIMDRNFVDFTFSPKVNALLRFNLTDEACKFILGYGYPLEDYQTIQRSFLEQLEEFMEVTSFPYLDFIKIPSEPLTLEERSYVTNFIGLLASRHTTPTKGIVAYYEDEEGIKRASFRSSILTLDFRSEFVKLGLDGRGHPSAFGILNLTKDLDFWKQLSLTAKVLFESDLPEIETVNVSHLGVWLKNPQKGYRIAKENCYVLPHHRVHINYTGITSRVVTKVYSERFALHTIDGTVVRSFNPDLTVENALILPMLDKGRPTLQLVEP